MSFPSMHLLLSGVFERHAQRTAVQGRSIAWTYAELDRLSASLAQALRERGAVPGQIVPILMGRSPLLVLSQLAVLRLGAGYSPIDMASPAARRRTMLDAIDSALLLCDDSAAVDAADAARAFDVVGWLAAQSRFAAPAIERWHTPPADCPVCVMFTSGSTGVPKGVMVPHAGIVRLVHEADYAHFGPEQRWAFMSSPAFDASTLEVWAALLNGGCCVIQEETHPSLDTLGEFLIGQRITDTWLTSALFNAMVEDQLASLGALRQLLVGGERVSPRHARLMLQAHPQARLINGYGPTENTTFTLCHTIGLDDTENPAGVPIGTPLSGTRVRVEPSDPRVPDHGELWTAGAGVALGYLGDAELTQAKFVWLDAARWYRTGDLVRRRVDGVFEFIGRRDRQVKVQGHRVEIDEVESALAACPGVGAGAVLSCGDDAASRHLVAFYSGTNGAPPDVEAVAGHLALRLPVAAMPKVFRPLKRLPVNLNGKVDRDVLAQLPPAEASAAAGSASIDPSMGAIEAALAAVWGELLPRASLRRDSHFMRVGGSSLLALHVAALVRKRLGRVLSPVDVLRHPVLSEQARILEQAQAAPREPGRADWNIPMTQAQRNVLAATRLDPTGCAYLVHVALHAPTLTDAEAWREAFRQLARRHPALRLQARHDGNGAHARLQPELPAGWWQQFPALAAVPGDLDWPTDLLNHVNRPLDTANDGSMRVDCWPVQGGGLLLVWTLHHHVIDEAGIATALNDLDALLQGHPLPPVYGSPFGFASIESAWAEPGADAAWAALLSRTLAGHAPPLEHAPAFGHERRLALDPALQQRLAGCCRALGCTPFPLLLAAYGQALQDAFGAAFRFVSTPFSRRAEPELIEPIGYLLDVRFIEAGALPGESLAQSLGRVARAVCRARAPAFQSLDTLITEVAAHDPQVAQCLSQFSFTWRLDPAGAITLAGQPVHQLRVPQLGSRYSLCLHVAQLGDRIDCSIEAVASAHDSGAVDRLWTAFLHRLDALCALRDVVLDDGAVDVGADVDTGDRNAHLPDDALRRLWTQWLHVGEHAIAPESHFLRSGGSSLAAMRMAAALRREHGLRLDIGAFLADPTFAKLGTLVRATPVPRADGHVLVGPADFARVMLMLPGSGGHAAGMYALADELHRRMPQGSAVAVVDLDAALQSAPDEDPLWFVSRRIVQIVRDLGQTRVTGIVGFSLGGSLALRIVEALGDGGAAIPVWMLDTFAPRAHRTGLWRKVERNLAWKLYGGRPKAGDTAPASPPAELQSLPMRASPAQWDVLGEQLARQRVAAPRSHVRLIQARQSVQHSGLLWQRRNNGFVPQHYGSWAVHEIDGAHLDIPRHLAASTADIIVGNERFDANGPE